MKHTLHILSWLTAFVWLSAATAHAQTTGRCAPAEAEVFLDVNNVRAHIFNNGALFWKGDPAVYEVPKDSGVNAIFLSSIWIGGRVQGELRVAAARYYNHQFWPGPLDDNGAPPADCTPFDRIYEITRADLITYAESGIPTPNLADWPWRLGAPVFDSDGIDDNYDLEAGDRPALIGDQMLWWVMNDAGNEHLSFSTETPPIGMEVHGSAFAFSRPNAPFDNATFYRYVLRYKGTAPLDDAYFGVFSDSDLGNFRDDYVGSDTTLHLGYTYNADNADEGEGGYGKAPPAVGYTFLRTPVANDGRDNNRDGTTDEPGEMLGMTHFLFYFGGGCVLCDPASAQDHYYYMQARRKDGQPLTVGGWGRDFSDIPTTYSFPGDPVTGAFWSAVNIDGAGSALDPSDVQFVMSTGPFTMQPGDAQDITFAIVWARGEDYLDSVRRLKTVTARLHEIADKILIPDVTFRVPDPPPEPTYGLGFAQNFPNPFSETTIIRYSVPQEMMIRLRVYDVLGREVAMLVDGRQAPGIYTVPFDAAGLPGGVYVYRIEMDHLRFTRRMLLVR